MARGNLKSDMATTLARATGATRAEALQTMRDMGISNDGRAERGSAADARQQRLLTNLGDPKGKSLGELASAIRRDWTQSEKGINFGARPYLEALEALGSIKDNYGADSAKSIATYFLSNATGWKGPVAKLVKDELKRRIKSGDDGAAAGSLNTDTRPDGNKEDSKRPKGTFREDWREDTYTGTVKGDLAYAGKLDRRPSGTSATKMKEVTEFEGWDAFYKVARENMGKSKAEAVKTANRELTKRDNRQKRESGPDDGPITVSTNYEENASQATLQKAFRMITAAEKADKARTAKKNK